MPGEPPDPLAEEAIRYQKDADARIATITFDRPGCLNAPTIAVRLRYADLLHRAGIDHEVKLLVIRRAGEDLGSGADLTEVMDVQNSGTVRPDSGDDFTLKEAIERGPGDGVNDNDNKFPPEWRLSKAARKKAITKKSDRKREH